MDENILNIIYYCIGSQEFKKKNKDLLLYSINCVNPNYLMSIFNKIGLFHNLFSDISNVAPKHPFLLDNEFIFSEYVRLFEKVKQEINEILLREEIVFNYLQNDSLKYDNMGKNFDIVISMKKESDLNEFQNKFKSYNFKVISRFQNRSIHNNNFRFDQITIVKQFNISNIPITNFKVTNYRNSTNTSDSIIKIQYTINFFIPRFYLQQKNPTLFSLKKSNSLNKIDHCILLILCLFNIDIKNTLIFLRYIMYLVCILDKFTKKDFKQISLFFKENSTYEDFKIIENMISFLLSKTHRVKLSNDFKLRYVLQVTGIIVNFRDLSENIKNVKKNIIFRSGFLGHYQECNLFHKYFMGLGIRQIIDLRNPIESNLNPYKLSIFEGVRIKQNTVKTDKKLLYTNFLNDNVKLIRSIFLQISKATNGAILISCAFGKDRTGIIIALILMSMGVARKNIVDDFLKSGSNVKENNILEIFSDIDKIGGISKYLFKCGIGKSTIIKIKNKLLLYK